MPLITGSVVLKSITGESVSKISVIDKLAINSGVDIPANGSAVEFDITGFVNSAFIQWVTVTQLTAGTADFTLEIWEKDASGYNPTTRADFYLRIYSRNFTVNEESDIIIPAIPYIDRDGTSELHGRLVNNAGGTASDFDVSIKY